MSAITIKDLLDECIKQVQKGNGSKKILLSSDDEGNEYHEMFFGFDENLLDEFKESQFPPFVRVPQEEWGDYIVLS